MAWILSESDAFKRKFSEITVQDSTSGAGRPVTVKYRSPQIELSDTEYPAIILDIENLTKDSTREHRGEIKLGYIPEDVYDPNNPPLTIDSSGNTVIYNPDTMPLSWSPIYSEAPIPYNIQFSVTVYARNRLHLIQIVSELVKRNRIPDRFGYIEIPERGTVQSLFLTGGPEISDTRDSNDKLVHTAYYEVQVATELLPHEIDLAYNFVYGVNITLDTIPDPLDGDPYWEPPVEVDEGFGIGAFGETAFGS